jgi:hypothetical protein
MRRIDLLFAALLLCVVLTVWFFADPRRKLKQTPDSEVYNAALLPLLHELETSSATKAAPNFLLLSPEYAPAERHSFKMAIDAAIRVSGRATYLEDLLDIRASATDKARVYEPLDLPTEPLSKLDLDEWIVIGNSSNQTLPRLRNRVGNMGRVLANLSVSLPSYSPAGDTAIVRLKSDANTIWGKAFVIVLGKEDGKWSTKYVIPGPPESTGPL